MRNWGIIITVFYSIIVVFFLFPHLSDTSMMISFNEYWKFINKPLLHGLNVFWIWIAILICGQALLLFLSVDTSWRRNKPRQHILVTSLLAGLLTGLLVFFYLWSLLVSIYSDKVLFTFFSSSYDLSQIEVISWWLGLWCFWGVLFYWYYRTSTGLVNKAVTWLLAGSVLELLIAVPAHVIVRHRDDCSAPIVTSWGIVTGIAVMLLSFGPGVLALYKKRIDSYAARRVDPDPATNRTSQ